MNRIEQAFENKKAFIPFITAGDPCLDVTKEAILAMQRAGADLIEIGIPFSDPVAEGPVIQEADNRALAAGTTTDKIFDMVESIRDQIHVPFVFMTYINPIYVYGTEKFAKRTRECGGAGVIVPDIPFEERGEIQDAFENEGLTVISMIAPTSASRAKMIAKEAKGFLYCVSSMGVTGIRTEINTGIADLIQQVKSVTDIPCAIGFGISTPEQAAKMAAISDGAIVGSAIVRLVEQYGKDCVPHIEEYVRSMKDAVR
ncbi:MAG: tryptophan synthase subunit alpha [Eubacterium sp.]|nr:tryptophan synthase subunit alpha [Eubacterium sp.]